MAQLVSSSKKPVDPVARLRKLISRKRTEKKRLREEMDALDAAMAPVREAARKNAELDKRLHGLFERALSKPGLTASSRAQIREVYEDLQVGGILSPALDEDELTEDDCPCPECTAARAARAGDARASDSAWGPEAEAEGARGPLGQDAPGGGFARETREHAAAAKPDRDKGLRALYHKLARQYHPDRAQDEAERSDFGDVMREVNDAYHSGDTQRLLELSRELGVDVEGLVGGSGLLRELLEQYELLKAEVRALRASLFGMLVVDTRRAKRHGSPLPLDVLQDGEEALGAELEHLCEFVGDFLAGKITLRTFLDGPDRGALFDDEGEIDEVAALETLLDHMNAAGPFGVDDLLEFVEDMARAAGVAGSARGQGRPAARTPRGKSGSKSKKSKKKRR